MTKGYRERYASIKTLYNQTASKAEQIALTQFLRDGHLNRHIKKTARLYEDKRIKFYKLLNKYFNDEAEIYMGNSGMEIGLVIHKPNLSAKIKDSGVEVHIVEEGNDATTLLLSCGIIEESEMEAAIKKLYIRLQK